MFLLCCQYCCIKYEQIDGGSLSESERKALFPAMDVANQGQNTYAKLTGLDLIHGQTYYIWVIGNTVQNLVYLKY